MRTPCNCGHRAVPDRTYRVPGERPRQQCRRCRRLIVSDGLRTTAQPRADRDEWLDASDRRHPAWSEGVKVHRRVERCREIIEGARRGRIWVGPERDNAYMRARTGGPRGEGR